MDFEISIPHSASSSLHLPVHFEKIRKLFTNPLKVVTFYTYYYATDACSRNRRFPDEMMHAGSIYENQIETF
jgi:hypothetical protein